MYVDIHSHIIPNIDDGAKDKAVAVEMLKLAENSGTIHIIATPHFISGAIQNTSDIIHEKCDILKKEATNEDMGINIYPGCEAFISPDLPDLYSNGAICTINNSSYILIEIPMMQIPTYTESVLYELQIRGLTPIIAHPERNMYIKRNPDFLAKLVKRGILAQANSSSIIGMNGKNIQKTVMNFIKVGMIHFIASDAHSCRSRSPVLTNAAIIIKKEFGHDVVEKLFFNNGMTVIQNGSIPSSDICSKYTKKNIFTFLTRNFKRSEL